MAVSRVTIAVSPDASRIVHPIGCRVAPVRVVVDHPGLTEALARAANYAAARTLGPVAAAVRTMYKAAGIDPTKTRPSSEALWRRAHKGLGLPRVNSLVDVVNWTSCETELPFGLYDCAAIDGAVTARLGRPGESYAGIRKDDVHLAGRLTLADAAGPFGNPTSDSARTMVTLATTEALIVVFAPVGLDASVAEHALQAAAERAGEYCAGLQSPPCP